MRWATSIFWCAIAALTVPTSGRAAGPTFCFIGVRWVDSGSESPRPDESAAITASLGVGTARGQLDRLAIELSRQFEMSPDYQEAKLATRQALSAYQAAKQDARLRLQQSPEGLAAQVEIDRLERQLDEAREQAKLAGRDHSERIDAIAMALLKQRSAVSRREAETVAADERLASLRYAWLDANARLEKLRDDFSQQLHSDPQWKTAKAQLEQARGALASIAN